MAHPAPHTTARQRGAATLVVTVGLACAMLLVAVYVNRNLIVEQRASAHQVQATQAFEAAEAGLEWALAQLNNPARIGSNCLSASAGTSFREHFLGYERARATYAVATWTNAGVATPRRAACIRTATAWDCSCPNDGTPRPAAADLGIVGPGFVLEFAADPQPGIVRVTATGCARFGGICAAAGANGGDATARLTVALGLVPGLKTAPAAPLTARGTVDAGGAAIGLHHIDPASGGFVVRAGAAVNAGSARLSGPAGTTPTDMVVAGDAALAGLSSEALFSTYFGMPRAAWVEQGVVTTLRCSAANCADELLAAIDPDVVHALIHVQGDLRLDGPLTLGTSLRPVVIVVDGAVQLHGSVVIHGVLHGRSLGWDDSAAPGALLRGAAISEGDYRGNGAPDLVYDPEVLATLKGNTGSFVRVSGSWRDF